MKLFELFTQEQLAAAMRDRLVRKTSSEDGSMDLYVYEPTAQFRRIWDDVTCACRGLVVDAETGEVLARPFPKFFNYGDPATGELDLDAPVECTDKADGSLAILIPGQDRLVTKGSFVSPQAQHATDLYRSRYEGEWQPLEGYTYLFEVIYPQGRIVLDYGDMDDLVLIGAVETDTGRVTGPNDDPSESWPGPAVKTFEYRTLRAALAAEPRPKAEGMVVRFLDGSNRLVKVKQQDYLELHKLVTNTTAHRLWEFLSVTNLKDDVPKAKDWAKLLRMDPATALGVIEAGDWKEGLLANVPDEFYTWVEDTVDQITSDFHTHLESLKNLAQEANSWGEPDRKNLVARMRAQQWDIPWQQVLSMLDTGVTYRLRAHAWLAVEPDSTEAVGWGAC